MHANLTPSRKNFCMLTQFIRPARDTYIRIFDELGDEVVTINARTSTAVTYPSGALGRTLSFEVNHCQLQFPVNQIFFVHLDEGTCAT